MHLADAFIQSDLHCIQVTVFTFLSALAFPGNWTHDLGIASAMLYYLSYRKATGNISVLHELLAEIGDFLYIYMCVCINIIYKFWYAIIQNFWLRYFKYIIAFIQQGQKLVKIDKRHL